MGEIVSEERKMEDALPRGVRPRAFKRAASGRKKGTSNRFISDEALIEAVKAGAARSAHTPTAGITMTTSPILAFIDSQAGAAPRDRAG
jgi:hypothetical protein